MDRVNITAVVGACAPERQQYARRLAAAPPRMLVSAARLAMSPDPLDEALALAPWSDRASGAVVEFPAEVPVAGIIGAFAEGAEDLQLREIVCVVDALHLMQELARDDYAVRRVPGRPGIDGIARALLAATQIEFASTVVLVNWEAVETPELSTAMALVSHLAPAARLRLHRDGEDSGSGAAGASGGGFGAAQERPGWVAILNGDFDPHMTDPRVRAFRYEQLRPFHPGRLARLLDERIEAAAFGTVLRSVGFCRLATRPGVVARWDHVGRMISFDPLALDGPAVRFDAARGADDAGVTAELGSEWADAAGLLALGQDLAVIGLDLDVDGLRAALDEAALDDAEFAAGPASWIGLPDPFPSWPGVPHGTR
ncbi:GTP-binding protein [Leucobacter allii]|uniref:GTP-binding protein n=1 Tax=Leucobacter allii TaxID=2932247 RepID=UPI001FCFBAAC|nr:GTP-binding protein [Leucobacter allii]UOR00842.1 GTP-binding protein [Leucobacter allii]